MSLITSCPACGTMFRVVPDQLKISEGWVRCGHCAEVFDATSHLADDAALEPGLAPKATRPADPPHAAAGAPAAVPAATASATADSVPPENSSFFGSDSQALEASPLDTPFVFRRSDLVPPGDASMFPPHAGDSQLPHDGAQDEELQEVSFVRDAGRDAFWRKPSVRLGLTFVSVLLGAALLLQVSFRDRDRLALAQPGLRWVLERMCRALACTVGAPRQIEAIVVESSAFNRLRSDTYRLAFTLRNTAHVQVAAPAIELTVTDSQDQPIVRRVLTPAELGAGDKVIPAAGDWSATAGVLLTVPGAARVAGYRLLAFYP